MLYGIIGAMPEEVESLTSIMKDKEEFSFNNKVFYKGTIEDKNVVVTCSGIGKVAAAIAATILINRFECNTVINTGIGGGLKIDIKTLDLVISDGAVYHDVDVTAFNYKIGQLPGHEQIIPTDKKLKDTAVEIANEMAKNDNFTVYSGLVATGDQFVAGKEIRENIDKNFPEAYVTEMEGCAIAQVCHTFNIPCLIIRSISDNANGEAAISFDEMLPLSVKRSQEITCKLLQKL